MWLAKSIYEPLPVVVMLVGAALAVIGLLAEREIWQFLFFSIGVLLLTAGLVLVLKRRAYRLSRSRRDFDRLG